MRVPTRTKQRIDRGKLVRFIEQYIEKHGRSPSIREMCRGVGHDSTSAVKYALRILERDGYVDITPFEHRSVRLTGKHLEHTN